MTEQPSPERQLADLIKGLIGKHVKARIGVKQWQGRKINVVEYYLEPVPKELAMLLLSNWKAWLEEHPCPEDDGRQGWIFDTACACRFHKLPPSWAARLIHKELTRDPERGEIEHAVSNAYNHQVSSEYQPAAKAEPYNPERLAHIASHVPFEVTDDWLAEVSPECVLDSSPAQFLDALFTPEERVWVGKHDADSGLIYHPGNAKDAKRMANYLKGSHQGAKYLINPVSGQEVDGSVRRTANLIDYRHLLIESDHAPRDLWLRMLVLLHAPILALYESGGRSIHAVIRLKVSTNTDPQERLKEFRKQADFYRRNLIPLGADKNAGNKACHLTRLPGIMRIENERMQRLLYLAPDARDGTPIYKKSAPTSNQLIGAEGTMINDSVRIDRTQ